MITRALDLQLQHSLCVSLKTPGQGRSDTCWPISNFLLFPTDALPKGWFWLTSLNLGFS